MLHTVLLADLGLTGLALPQQKPPKAGASTSRTQVLPGNHGTAGRKLTGKFLHITGMLQPL